MGGALAQNLVDSGNTVITHDLAGPERSPAGATFTASLDELAAQADIVVLSLPDGNVSRVVTAAIAAAPRRRVQHIVDTSTIGPQAAGEIRAALEQVGIGYLDAPVSGGVAGAKKRTLMVMYAGTDEVCAAVDSTIASLSDRHRRVGDRAGMAQALKLANNFLSAICLTASSEAINFLMNQGLEMEVALEVLNASSGQSAATSDKFVNHVVTGRYAAGFANNLMAKDVRLYLSEVRNEQLPAAVGELTETIWNAFADAQPGVDFTRIYPFVARLED
jgi:3-hydroxyisobutyrate dehydrogenase